MLQAADGLLACPVCGGVLTLADRAARCPAGHSFDVARQGYLNLLRSAPPPNADTAAMVDARVRVLASGAFDALDAALADLVGAPPAEPVETPVEPVETPVEPVETPVEPVAALRILDVGGGTGHHLARLLDALPHARGVSLDVSVPAARRAARAHARAASVVGDAWATLPLATGTVDVVVCLFAPRNPREFARVLAPGGLLVVATPEPEHLASVRARYGLLRIEADKEERLLRSLAGLFDLQTRRVVRTPLDASAGLVGDLIAMGPNAFHGLPGEVDAVRTEIAVSLWLFRRA